MNAMEADILKVASDKKGISHCTNISSLHQGSVKEYSPACFYMQQNMLFFSYPREYILNYISFLKYRKYTI